MAAVMVKRRTAAPSASKTTDGLRVWHRPDTKPPPRPAPSSGRRGAIFRRAAPGREMEEGVPALRAGVESRGRLLLVLRCGRVRHGDAGWPASPVPKRVREELIGLLFFFLNYALSVTVGVKR